jgi:hypothetical protein
MKIEESCSFKFKLIRNIVGVALVLGAFLYFIITTLAENPEEQRGALLKIIRLASMKGI